MMIDVRFKACILCIAAVILYFAVPPHAAAKDNAETINPKIVRQAEEYLRNLDQARAHFLQTAHNGAQLTGTFYIDRPGKLRFEYDDLDDFIVADGVFIYFYDAELQQQTNAPIGQTLAHFLLRENLSFDDKELTVVSTREANGFAVITLTQKDDPGAGQLLLGFTANPFALKKWRVIDAQNMITEIELFRLEENIPLDKSLFVYSDPVTGEHPGYNE